MPLGYDPAGKQLVQALTPKSPVRRQPAIVNPGKLREMLRKAEELCKPTTKFATRLIALTAARMGTVMYARWERFVDFDGPEPVWEIPAENMKGKKGLKLSFTVSLCNQAVEVVKAARMIRSGFP